MDTSKILAFRHASQAELLLEALLQSLDRVPGHASRVTERSDLPAVLQRIVLRGAKQRLSWAAWARDKAFWFYTAEVIAAPIANVGRSALKVSGYDERGRLTECGVWVNPPGRGWARCAL
jgi:hypothetical protein